MIVFYVISFQCFVMIYDAFMMLICKLPWDPDRDAKQDIKEINIQTNTIETLVGRFGGWGWVTGLV